MNGKPDAAIFTQDLCVGYGKREVLYGLDLSFPPGAFTALLGPNGAGKTTLLRTLARLLPPIRGKVFLQGKNLNEYASASLARRLSVVLTEKVNPGIFSVSEFVGLGRHPHTGFMGRLSQHDLEIVRECLEWVKASDLANRQMTDLSDGERQKVSIARALAQEPEIILLDEPTMHLDLKHRMEVMGILRHLCREKGVAVVASLHDVDVAARVSDMAVCVSKGKMVRSGPTEQVLSGNRVAELYDFEEACFDPGLCTLELRPKSSRERVFVASGMGSGAGLFRLLSKHGFSIAAGVMHSNDLDRFVASAIGAACFIQNPQEPVGGDSLDQAMDSVLQADFLVDAGYEVGPVNQNNTSLIHAALSLDKPVFSLRSPEEARELFGNRASFVVLCSDSTDLVNKILAVSQARHDRN